MTHYAALCADKVFDRDEDQWETTVHAYIVPTDKRRSATATGYYSEEAIRGAAQKLNPWLRRNGAHLVSDHDISSMLGSSPSINPWRST